MNYANDNTAWDFFHIEIAFLFYGENYRIIGKENKIGLPGPVKSF